MSYFSKHQARLKLPVGLAPTGKRPTLRRGQRGAIRAIEAHFALGQDQPALIVMPTGSGKTAVLMLAPFVLGAERALVISPSRLVRYQVANDFRELQVLRKIGIVPNSMLGPSVVEVDRRVRSLDQWNDLREADVVVATPHSISPSYKDIPRPPDDLFDLVLVDEAHHTPATTWNTVLECFPKARRVLFTATPFRRDERDIQGKFVFTYPVSEAVKEGIFSKIVYVPVENDDDALAARDTAIAKKAEEVLRADQAAGHPHALMVRTDERKRADELAAIYARETGLTLRLVHSGLSYRRVQETLAELEDGAIDGIICVDMLGEGYDLPKLKVAAIHAPHKSLSVTLQFIGRFARPGDGDLEAAKFLAIPNDITMESVQLYSESAAWQEIVPELLEQGIAHEVENKRIIETFAQWEHPGSDESVDAVSLYALQPYFHVRVYQIKPPIDLDAQLDLGRLTAVEYRWTSVAESATVFITRMQTRPRWTTLSVFPMVRHDLFVVYVSRDGKFLFICASQRDNDSLYQAIADQLAPQGASRIDQETARRALMGLTDLEQFMVGMRSPLYRSRTESYRMIAGSLANRAIQPADGQTYLLGHSYGRGQEDGREITIGWSGNAKVWSNTTDRIPALLTWCERVAQRLASTGDVVTGSEIDWLRMGVPATAIPAGVIAAEWPEDAYTRPARVRYFDDYGVETELDLLDLDLEIDQARCTSAAIHFYAVGRNLRLPIVFRLGGSPSFVIAGADRHRAKIQRGRHDYPLIDYFNYQPLAFFFWDFSYLIGGVHYPSARASWDPFPADRIEVIDWAGAAVDIQREYGPAGKGKISVHDHVEALLRAEGCEVVFYDHQNPEAADFIAGKDDGNGVCFTLYHCKKSGRRNPGSRVADLYEVCGQVEKSMRWVNDGELLRRRMEERAMRQQDRWRQGDLAAMDRLLGLAKARSQRFRLVIVQPGLSRGRLSEDVAKVLGAADAYVMRWGCDYLRVWGSA